MADVNFKITLKDIDQNLIRVLKGFDLMFPGRPTGTAQKDWIIENLSKFLIDNLHERLLKDAKFIASNEELAKPKLIITIGDVVYGK